MILRMSGMRRLTVAALLTALAASAAFAQPRRLNNLVTELLHVEGAEASAATAFAFDAPREGWIFVRSRAVIESLTPNARRRSGFLALTLDADTAPAPNLPVTWHREYTSDTLEGMRYIAAGRHTLKVDTIPGSRLDALTVRAVPELIYSSYVYNPFIAEFGPYDWNLLQRIGMLDVINMFVASYGDPHVAEWRLVHGKRVIQQANPPGLGGDISQTVTVEGILSKWSEEDARRPFNQGLIVDEFYPGERMNKFGDAWLKACLQFTQEHPARLFYPYVAGDSTEIRPFVEPLLATHARFAYERYLLELPTEAEARESIRKELVDGMRGYQAYAPDFQKRCIVVMGFMCAPPASFNNEPNADYKTYLDMQMNVMANDPVYDGLFGLETYTSGYCDEEYQRWCAKLFRHYAIEGRTEPVATDPYELKHLRNPDFVDGFAEWTASPASAGTLDTGEMKGYSRVQGRGGRTGDGNHFCRMKRSAEKPNTISQELRALVPGRTYSVKLVVGDYQELTREEKRPCSVRVENAETLSDLSFQGVYKNSLSAKLEKYSDGPFWFNFVRVVFRAKADTARLVISDWVSDTEPGGRIGQELMFNFVQVEPFLMPE